VVFVAFMCAAANAAGGEKRYGPGVSDTEIKIGNTMPYSGPLSNVGTQGRTEAAYFKMLNERGGVNGRKITFISLDDRTARLRPLSACASWSSRSKC
jgi:ABC-type branched-subunit amino acid transport system substrate-binding protein